VRSATISAAGPGRRGEIFFSAVTGVPVSMERAPALLRSGALRRWTAFDTAPPATLLIRAAVGAVFLLEGSLKFIDPDGFGVGRFTKIGIPFPSFFAPFDGVFEIACGLALMVGLLTRWAAIPMIVNMVVAITTTKVPMLFRDGFFKAAHEARLDVTMLLACLFLLLAGAGPLSLDSLLASSRGRRHGEAGLDADVW
jgi:putative oxidoreductase